MPNKASQLTSIHPFQLGFGIVLALNPAHRSYRPASRKLSADPLGGGNR